MAKIRLFYISKVNDKLKYTSSKYSKDELKDMINELLNNLEKDLKRNKPERKIGEQYEIPNHIVSVLILENIFDINNIPFIKDPEDNDENDDENDDKDKDNDDDDNENNNNSKDIKKSIMDYDIEELAAKYCE
ncbi:hypothetical protein RclHR1_03690001 [Rhizophagus clarus]|uniref:Uncharacterized protein n=1 Tax=Rhizophagus clarus TaxID=94130 RepID=A0A2Z6S716_9GLOM|nr:hypothetical protein RclHR1_03690001 [Rhizophagus clarus]GES77903.1 hypothetical protein RCL_jg29414.t1 [Rhizophagus clarus]